MSSQIKTILVIQHSHTDIGYTDIQERIIDRQVENIRSVVRTFESGQNPDYRWVCETFYPVLCFLDQANEAEREQFFKLVKQDKIGLSLNYLNFNDLVDGDVLKHQIMEFRKCIESYGILDQKTAMCADITGLSMGQRDALLTSGVEFMYMNMNATHAVPVFGKRHYPFLWENSEGQKLLVWSGEHYNIGNALGLRHESVSNPFFQLFVGDKWNEDPIENIHDNLNVYLPKVMENGYPYDFLPVSVSGRFTDNSPHNPEIIRNIRKYNEKYGQEIEIRMVTLEELYEEIRRKVDVEKLPVYKGDMADWWANGIGCVPFAVSHYQEARSIYHTLLSEAPEFLETMPELVKKAETNMLLFAEHTYGHAATASEPFSKEIRNLDFRNQMYASLAHSAVSKLLDRYVLQNGGTLRPFEAKGRIAVSHRQKCIMPRPVYFEIEAAPAIEKVRVFDKGHQEVPVQTFRTSRGLTTLFLDGTHDHPGHEYTYAQALPGDQPSPLRLSDTSAENEWIRIEWQKDGSFTSWFDKTEGTELISDKDSGFMMPIYEAAPIRFNNCHDRGLLGLNTRAENSETYLARIQNVKTVCDGPLFTDLLFELSLEGCYASHEVLRIWHTMPRVDVSFRVAKNPTEAIESMYMPFTVSLPEGEMWIRKGNHEVFRPGLDQLTGTAEDYIVSDFGVLFRTKDGEKSYGVYAPDTALLSFSPYTKQSAKGCEPKAENASRAVRSWIMNNTWETNFTLDLSGFMEFKFSLMRLGRGEPGALCDQIELAGRKTLAVFCEESENQ